VRLNLRIWRQSGPSAAGKLVDYTAEHVSPDMSFLEMLDVVNEGLTKKGQDAIAFDSDCREGICGMCSLVVNGVPHGPDRGTTVCQLHMRRFKDGDTITIEPWRAKAFPVEGSRRRSERVRSHHRRGRLLLRQRRRRAGRQRDPDSQRRVRAGDGFGRVHRLRRVRRRLQERVGAPVRGRQAHPSGAAPAGPAGALPPGRVDGRTG
jgi:hypothetical protein